MPERLTAQSDPSPDANGPASAFRSRSGTREGFALIAVIWSLGLITLLSLALIVGARYRARVSSSYASALATELAAQSAIHLAVATALTGPAAEKDIFPLTCRMPGGERATITVEEETGKVDLNAASLATLSRLFTALARDQSLGTRIAARVVEFRDLARMKTASAAPTAPGTQGFTTIMQLDAIKEVSPSLFRSALRFITVRSGRPEPDPEAATPALLRLLNASAPQSATSSRGFPTGGSVTIRADVSGPDGGRFIREALVLLGSENGRPFVIREWRHGDIGSEVLAPLGDGARNPKDCLRILGHPSS
ncbi:type II secretion system protein GspK [Bradyrhizobium lablabi]|uniref:type II secretion system protein GspK n=1 Tax=Bradyrhizobium lablabi TaxID=722472 RepID=UPI001BA61710|nr:type II secretion system protein GspK [Bradyrhizobium lablabi]MBR0697760.1 general secretion pathway protein GspK [Bradyrhizobium lablabi]